MEKKPTLSPSKITTYLACPLKYGWTYVDRRGKWYLRARSYFSFGTTLHRVLERFHNAEDVGVETTHQAIAAYEENWLDAGFSSADEMADAFGEGKEILERYIEEEQVQRAGRNTLHVEKLFKHEYPEFVLVGRVDRLDEHDDGTIEIVDYKTGRQSVQVEDVQTDIAMGCYQLLVRKEFPDRAVRATIVCLRSGEQASYSMNNEEIADFEFAVQEIGNEILSRDYDVYAPQFKRICTECDFLTLCRRRSEFLEPPPDEFAMEH